MSSIEGTRIQQELKGFHLRQRWLLHKLWERGFPKLTESTLSRILTGDYIGGCAPAVIQASLQIVKEQKESA